ncbi:hypothetical protein RVR_4401 [Actinacidiphila reveromycinica]|uniref:Uncharacterized protein n=1 Tax=Actinacidiphila reveromycinica TaxID=659352 RepID=A0A7U3UTA2_9ACTN|nr:hypothetical protein [Streptomyces sp. SN-593]BBA98271.1 hypothetical protein RVR_4401 [Streptomyces sp. SN-593]
MTGTTSGGLAVLVTARLLVPAARVFPRRRGGSPAGFRSGPPYAWCPAEGRETPHALDAGGRRCRSCKTTTPTPETTTSEETHVR